MMQKILPITCIAACLFASNANAQSKKAFAVTSDVPGTFSWNTIREIDLSSGETVNTFYDTKRHNSFEIVTDQNARLVPAADNRSQIRLMPMAEGVAATAFDEKHNRLYYTTMRGNELRYFDLNNPKGKVVYNQSTLLFEGNRYDEANVITRMAFGADGAGYALTNDAKNLVKFSTGQKPVITNLGQVRDGAKNGAMSVHNLCSSWGGDMVGDAYGNLYLVSMRSNVFKINPQTMVADFIGAIKGLPAEYTTNGMAVDDNGEVLLSSAAVSGTFYKVNMATLQATQLKNGNTANVYNASDLASSNLLYKKTGMPLMTTTEILGNDKVSVYPNPVSNKAMTVQFDKVPAGRYNLTLLDASGKIVLARSLVINFFGQVEKINLPRSASGMYLLKVSGGMKEVFSNKVIVQ